jgi:hypothetical protein
MYNRGTIITEDEKNLISNWATNIMYPKMKLMSNRIFHYIMLENDKNILELIWTIKNRIIEKEGLYGYKQEETLRDFLIYLPKGSHVSKHVDPNKNNLIHTRFNVFVTSPLKGCVTYYDNNIVDTTNLTYALCRSGIDEHYITTNEDDNITRITLSFGFLLPTEKLDELTSDKNIGTYKFYPLTYPALNNENS